LKGLDLLPKTESISRSICRINLGHAQTMQNHPLEAQQAFEDVMPPSLESRNFLSGVAASFYMSRLAFYMQSVDRGEMACRHWKHVIGEVANSSGQNKQPVAEVPALRGLDIVQGMILLERGQVEEAEHIFFQSLDTLGWGSWMELLGFVELAQSQNLRGDDAGAQETLHRMTLLGPQHVACAEALQALFEIKRSPHDAQIRSRVELWAKAHSPDPAIPLSLGIGPYHRDTEYICNLAWARVQIALGHPGEASSFIEPALEIAKERGLLYRLAELAVAHALIYEELGDPAAALKELEKALEISGKCGYTRIFNQGPQLDRLLQQAIEKKIHAAYARQLLASFSRASGKANVTTVKKEQPGLVDPLSERELEVLRFLADGLTPAEIAKRLYLSPFTLKAHTQNIYSKLEAHSRIEAINKARRLGLI
jgi:LuxR family maltose regulon positive regulatory protein